MNKIERTRTAYGANRDKSEAKRRICRHGVHSVFGRLKVVGSTNSKRVKLQPKEHIYPSGLKLSNGC